MWTPIGHDGDELTGIEDPMIGVYATASTQPGVSEPTASFHSVAIEPECEPDTSPPVTTVELNGPRPSPPTTGR